MTVVSGRMSRERCRLALLAGLSGRVIEVGAGRGQNFAGYPPEVTSLVAVEPSRRQRDQARQAAARARAKIVVVDGTAEHLPSADGEFDAVVASLVLCSVADQAAALAEIRRVLRPGGELRYYEHVVSERPAVAALERLIDAAGFPRLARGCHSARDTGAAIRRAGFLIEAEQRIAVSQAQCGPAVTHILGLARPA